MGSSQSQPSRSSGSSSSSSSPRPARPPLRPNSTNASASSSNSTSRFSTFRRLSALTRRDSSKRNRTGSTGSSDAEQKKRRVDLSPPPPQPIPLSSPRASPIQDSHLPLPSTAPTLAPPISPPATTPIPPGSPDLLLPDRLRTLSTIRDTLGPDWPSTTPNASVAQERLGRLRRQSLPLESPNRLSDRLYSFLGIHSTSPGASSPIATPGIDTSSAIVDIDRQLDAARADLADTSRQLDEARSRLQALEREGNDATASDGPQENGGNANDGPLNAQSAPTAPSTTAAGPASEQRRAVPAGAVMVIQGLAQTHAVEDSPETEASDTAASVRPTPRRSRSSSDSALSSPMGWRRRSGLSNGGNTTSTESGNGQEDPLEAQARMISGLLTVAATATATTLLAPSAPPPTEPRASTGNPLSNLMDRLRPQRRNAPTVEAALGDYLRNALRDRRRADQGSTMMGVVVPEAPSVDTGAISDDFQQFLEAMRTDLVGAVREFATLPPRGRSVVPGNTEPQPDPAPSAANGLGDQTVAPAPSVDSVPSVGEVPRVEVADGPVSPMIISENDEAMDIDASATNLAGNARPEENAETPLPIPSFHYQAGQSRSDDASRRFGVSGGEDGIPRRLNFFRAHQFPPVIEGQPEAQTGTDDPNGMVPCIFVGIRSLAHDPTMTTDQLVQHPNFPFADGQVPPGGDAAPNTSAEASSEVVPPVEESTTPGSSEPPSAPTLTRSASDRPATPIPGHSAAGTDRRSIRERLLDRFNPRRPPRPVGPLNTYLVFVIGGYYPRSHPVLSIPNLMTGGPLSDEEMALVSELLGPGKPPTASKDDIANSGLEVCTASDIPRLGQEGKILENCVERCLVCLGDYEEGEECRVLKCRHAFHKDCVDHWLSEGRNSCPACRTEAVEVKSTPAATTATAPTATNAPAAGPSTSSRSEQSDPLLDEVD